MECLRWDWVRTCQKAQLLTILGKGSDPRNKVKGKVNFSLLLFECWAPIPESQVWIRTSISLLHKLLKRTCTLPWIKLAEKALICLKLLMQIPKVIMTLISKLSAKFCFIYRLFLKGKGTRRGYSARQM